MEKLAADRHQIPLVDSHGQNAELSRINAEHLALPPSTAPQQRSRENGTAHTKSKRKSRNTKSASSSSDTSPSSSPPISPPLSTPISTTTNNNNTNRTSPTNLSNKFSSNGIPSTKSKSSTTTSSLHDHVEADASDFGLDLMASRFTLPLYLLPPLIGFLIFCNGLSGGLVFDDTAAIENNRDLRPESSWWDMWYHDYWGNLIKPRGGR